MEVVTLRSLWYAFMFIEFIQVHMNQNLSQDHLFGFQNSLQTTVDALP